MRGFPGPTRRVLAIYARLASCGRALRSTGLVGLAALCALSAGCGYGFVGRALDAPITLSVTSDAADPGMALTVRRALESHAAAFGLTPGAATHSEPAGTLVVRVLETSDLAAGVMRVEHGGHDAIAATSYDAVVVVEARWTPTLGEPVTTCVTGRAPYADQLLALATEDARALALQRAADTASRDVVAWVVAQRLSATSPDETPPEPSAPRSP